MREPNWKGFFFTVIGVATVICIILLFAWTYGKLEASCEAGNGLSCALFWIMDLFVG